MICSRISPSTQCETTPSRLAALLAADMPSAHTVERLKHRLRPYICPFDSLLEHIEPDRSYFDIGCGSGAFLRILAEYKSPTALGGVEVSNRLIENAATVLARCDVSYSLQLYDGIELPAQVVNFDYLFLIDVLHHVPRSHQDVFLTRIFDRMRTGQRLLLKDIDAASRLVHWNKLHDLLLSHQIGHERTCRSVQAYLDALGFRIDLCFTKRVLLYPHYLVLCTKV